MPKITLDDMTPEQIVVVTAFINEGKLQAYEELVEYLEREHFSASVEDPYYAYYVKHVIEIVQSKYDDLSKETK